MHLVNRKCDPKSRHAVIIIFPIIKHIKIMTIWPKITHIKTVKRWIWLLSIVPSNELKTQESRSRKIFLCIFMDFVLHNLQFYAKYFGRSLFGFLSLSLRHCIVFFDLRLLINYPFGIFKLSSTFEKLYLRFLKMSKWI
jgi:hypothetical protein